MRCPRGMPGVLAKLRRLNFRGEVAAQLAEFGDIEPKPPRPVRLDVSHSEMKKPHRRAEPRAILRVERSQKLLLQVNESARDLDEPLVKEAVFVTALEPEMLEHVVGFVVFPRIEAGEIAGIARVELPIGGRAELGNEGRDALTFFHRAMKAWELSCAILCLTRCQ